MRKSITQELIFRKHVVEYAIKTNNQQAAIRYHLYREKVRRWKKKYDGTLESLKDESKRPNSHPNQHTEEELELIKQQYKRFGHEGYAQVYRKLKEKGYKRSYGSMCKQIRNLKLKKVEKRKRYPKSKYRPLVGLKPGEILQMDIKHVPLSCIGFNSKEKKYYQITIIDLYSRKRWLKLVDEKSNYNTAKFLVEVMNKEKFIPKIVQTDNGKEFVYDDIKTNKLSKFQKTLKRLGIEQKKTRPYSPWQNGVVERSHRVDNERFYNRHLWKTEEQMKRSFNYYRTRTNNIASKQLNFKTPNEMFYEKTMPHDNKVTIPCQGAQA